MIINDFSQIKTGDCLLVSSCSFLAKAIQWFERCEYNHAGMFYWCYDTLMVIEAEKEGVIMTPFLDYINKDDYKLGKIKLLLLRPEFDVDGSEYGKFMLPYLGKTRYGFFNLLLAQSIRFLTAGRIWIGPSGKNKKRFICGEWVAFVYSRFNPYFHEWYRYAPSDLFDDLVFTHNIILIK